MGEVFTGDHDFDQLVNLGVYKFVGLDERQQPTFALDAEMAKKHAPDVLAAHDDDAHKALLAAIEEGYVEFDATIEPDGTLAGFVKFTEKCDELFEDSVA